MSRSPCPLFFPSRTYGLFAPCCSLYVVRQRRDGGAGVHGHFRHCVRLPPREDRAELHREYVVACAAPFILLVSSVPLPFAKAATGA